MPTDVLNGRRVRSGNIRLAQLERIIMSTPFVGTWTVKGKTINGLSFFTEMQYMFIAMSLTHKGLQGDSPSTG